MELRQIINRLLPFLSPDRWLIMGTLALTLIGALTAQVNPLVLRHTVDEIDLLLREGKSLEEGLPLLGWITVILFGKELLNIFIQFGQKFYGEKLRINVSFNLAQSAVERILTYKMSFYTSQLNQSGRLQTRIDRGVESLTKLVQNFFIDVLPLFANAVVALVVMFSANVSVGLVAICVLPAYFYVSFKQAQKLQGVRRKLRGQREDKNNGLINLIDSISVIKSFVREKYEGRKQLQLQQKLMDLQLQTRRTSFIFEGLKTFIEQIGVVLIIILTAYLVLDRQISIGAIMFHIMLFGNVSAPIRQLHRIYDEMNDALIYAEGYFSILDAKGEIESLGHTISEPLKGDYLLENVNFYYPTGVHALKNVNIHIPHGKTTALVGLSGAGKSTVINLLTKFYVPESGQISLDGIALNDYDTHALRDDIGLVLQKNHIFKGSIEENIRYGKPSATLEEVQEAAKKAFLHEQILDLPDQYKSDASQLSGGQQQRIAIARLFLKDPPIIFLDEPTASLDAIVTEQIRNSIEAIKQGRTVVIISHSIAQIMDADVIYVMQRGEVVEKGKHEQLYEQEGVYRHIFDASTRSLNLDKIAKTLDNNAET
ncbi:ABC transporter ATP-binding protein [Runella sp. MFBS21]|uniref:ABC transporter ATP-binding protein n=1 Tax=Runella sp. MFBS21 TaxID=3034018 RepID=UPI0023F93972|nr:ABC transporter ATP-binding protein [Runella sp. MFBS21]MDF7818257.1 ABC transporter ATP-binding protein [Runella sp. MFBS21]